MDVTLHLGDCLDGMRGMEAQSVDAIVTDPPYGLSFMGKDWDHGVPGVHFWQEALRVTKPGAHLFAFGGTRTFHRLAVAIEDAGWEIRDCLMWLYGQGFPKGKNQLKPAWEPIIMARKPLDGTVAANVLAWGTGALNIDGCRVATVNGDYSHPGGRSGGAEPGNGGTMGSGWHTPMTRQPPNPIGRWPANVIHDGSDEVVELFPESNNGHFPNGGKRTGTKSTGIYGAFSGTLKRHPGGGVIYGVDAAGQPKVQHSDSGSAARFFYCAKASKRDREEGLEEMPEREAHKMSDGECIAEGRTAAKGKAMARNYHPTVKPTDLMRYLCRLVTPPGGIVLDPFMGSGSTGKAAMMEGLGFWGIELDAGYFAIAERRIAEARAQLFLGLEAHA